MEVWCLWEGLASYERLVLQSSFVRACWRIYICPLPDSSWCPPRLSTLSNLVPSGDGPSPPSPKSQFLWPQCLWALSHADDIRTLATSISESKQQITYVHHQIYPQFRLASPLLTLPDALVCGGPLAFLALSGSMSTLKKARVAFFTRGSGIFHGILNPLSSISIVESCVLPCLLSGAEAWILNCTLLQKLESFQAELAKRILKLPKHTSNNVALMALQWPSIKAHV